MYSIGIVGDLHIDSHVSSRKDDYFNTCLLKLEEVSSNCKNVIILGDFFNRENIASDYLYNLYIHLTKLKSLYGCKYYAIIGNHDIANEDENNLSKSSLGILQVTNLVNIIFPNSPINIEGINFYTSYVNLEKCRKHLKTLKLGSNDVLLLHQYFEDAMLDGLFYDDVKDIGCRNIFLGHEHTPFDGFVKNYGDVKIYRCGSLLRNSANKSNLERDIFYFGLNSESIVPIKLGCMKPAIEVFTEKSFNQENLQKKIFIKSIQDVMDKYTNNISTQVKFSMKETLKEINTPEDCFQYIQNIYNMVGEVLQ